MKDLRVLVLFFLKSDILKLNRFFFQKKILIERGLFMGLFTQEKKYLDVNELENEEASAFRVDLMEDNDNYYLIAEVPGKQSSQIKLRFKGERLSVSVMEDSDVDENLSCIKMERVHDECERIFSFEDPIEKNKVSAACKDGLLSITIPKVNLESDEGLISIKQL